MNSSKSFGVSSGKFLGFLVHQRGVDLDPTMQRDAQEFAKKCQECYRQGDEIHTNHQSLHPTMAPYPFHSWGLDFIGPISPSSEGCV